MSAMTTFIPAPSRALAMPSPMPLAPPVTNAVLPGRFCMPRFPHTFGGDAPADAAARHAHKALDKTPSVILYLTHTVWLWQSAAREGGHDGRGSTRRGWCRGGSRGAGGTGGSGAGGGQTA